MHGKRYCICTAAYPQAALRIQQYADALAALLGAREDVCALVVAEAGMTMPAALRDIRRIEWVSSQASAPAPLRGAMLEMARDVAAEWLLFVDFDDRIKPGAADLWDRLSSEIQIGYADLDLIDSEGEALGRLMFDHLPDTLVARDLEAANCLGFSNTALNRQALNAEDCNVPDGLIAVDWWLFSRLLQRGIAAGRIDGVVADYRQYDGNQLGADEAGDASAIERRVIALEAHYRALNNGGWLNRIKKLRDTPDWPKALLRHQPADGAARWWFQSLTASIGDLTAHAEKAM